MHVLYDTWACRIWYPWMNEQMNKQVNKRTNVFQEDLRDLNIWTSYLGCHYHPHLDSVGRHPIIKKRAAADDCLQSANIITFVLNVQICGETFSKLDLHNRFLKVSQCPTYLSFENYLANLLHYHCYLPLTLIAGIFFIEQRERRRKSQNCHN